MGNKSRAFTTIELMVTLTIVGIATTLAIITMRGYIPKQQLISSVGYLEGLIQRAQSEANARSYWTCIQFSEVSGRMRGTLWADVNGDRACGNTGDVKITELDLKPDIVFPACGGNITWASTIWFDTMGGPKACPVGGAPCTDSSYEIILSNPKLGIGARAREIELLAGGLVQTVRHGEIGLATGLCAALPGDTRPCACE